MIWLYLYNEKKRKVLLSKTVAEEEDGVMRHYL